MALGTSILDATYEGAMFDSGSTIRKSEDDDDNFDIVLATAERIRIIRPLLRPEILLPMLTDIRKRIKDVIKDVLTTFLPVETSKSKPKEEEKRVTRLDGEILTRTTPRR